MIIRNAQEVSRRPRVSRVVERAPFPSHTGLVCTRQLMGTQFAQFKFFYILFPQQFSFFAQECAYT